MSIKQWFKSKPCWLKGGLLSLVFGFIIITLVNLITKSSIISIIIQQSLFGYWLTKIGFIVFGTFLGFVFIKKEKIIQILLYSLSIILLIWYVVRINTIFGCDYFGGGCGYYDFLLGISFLILSLVIYAYLTYFSYKLYTEGIQFWVSGIIISINVLIYGNILSLGGISYLGFVTIPPSLLLIIGSIIGLIIGKIKSKKVE